MKNKHKVKISLYRVGNSFYVRGRCADVRVWHIMLLENFCPCCTPEEERRRPFFSREPGEVTQCEGVRRSSWLELLMVMNIRKDQVVNFLQSVYSKDVDALCRQVVIEEV